MIVFGLRRDGSNEGAKMKDRLKYSGGGDGSSTIRRLSLVAIFMDRLRGTYMVEEERKASSRRRYSTTCGG